MGKCFLARKSDFLEMEGGPLISSSLPGLAPLLQGLENLVITCDSCTLSSEYLLQAPGLKGTQLTVLLIDKIAPKGGAGPKWQGYG